MNWDNRSCISIKDITPEQIAECRRQLTEGVELDLTPPRTRLVGPKEYEALQRFINEPAREGQKGEGDD